MPGRLSIMFIRFHRFIFLCLQFNFVLYKLYSNRHHHKKYQKPTNDGQAYQVHRTSPFTIISTHY